MKRLELPRDEIAFRQEYEDVVLNEQLTVVFRPGNRVFPVWRGYKQGELITARIIKTPGDDSKFIPPVFTEDKKELIIRSIRTFHLSDLKPSDFVGSSDDVKSVEDLKKHLLWIYKKEPSEFNFEVTRIELEYVKEVCKLDAFCQMPLEL